MCNVIEFLFVFINSVKPTLIFEYNSSLLLYYINATMTKPDLLWITVRIACLTYATST